MNRSTTTSWRPLVAAYQQVEKRIGDPTLATHADGPARSTPARCSDCTTAVEKARAAGGKVLHRRQGPEPTRPGNFVLPTIVTGLDNEAEVVQDGDLRPDPLRDAVQDAGRGDGDAQRRAAGPVLGDLHPRPAGGRAFLSAAGSRLRHRQRQHRHQRAPRSAAPSAARRKPAAAASRARDAWKVYMRRQTNTINYSDATAAGAGHQVRILAASCEAHRAQSALLRSRPCRSAPCARWAAQNETGPYMPPYRR